ncbi:hypothetical protein CR105_17025 [Massilia eurypsychrophila]|jgi:hypothetical protein|uniref:DUF2783 domain-containing protein n=1 Tax=Massilia eurypsychrophila TaxID=1485217 RepID=A0A2G8TCG8_9BURK|nr:hypothetical protein [Massilia eurypsychrophila]PIL43736.1 hypothetical protein CR105_17025 [Massilia eurypsychrophila]
MQDSELDAVYTRLCKTMTEVGADRSPLFLARFAMLAIIELGEPALAMRLIDAAADGNTDQTGEPL